MLTALPFDARAMDHVPEMRDHAHLSPKLAVFIEINSPGIAAAFGENFEGVPSRMITPDAGVHPLTLAWCRAGTADMARTKNAMTTVKPAIRPPSESVQDFMRIRSVIPAI